MSNFVLLSKEFVTEPPPKATAGTTACLMLVSSRLRYVQIRLFPLYDVYLDPSVDKQLCHSVSVDGH